MNLPENINKEFVCEFLAQLGKVYTKRKIEFEKPKIKEEETKELRFIRPLAQPVQKPKPMPKIEIKAKPEEPAINKVKELMKDASLNAIICEGADKKIKTKRGNVILETPISLSEDEIKRIFKQISKETNTPLNKVFKTRYGNFMINAIMSDFIGSKFVLIRTQ